jgi:hypothetical protein
VGRLECGEHRRFGFFLFEGEEENQNQETQSGDPRRTPNGPCLLPSARCERREKQKPTT